MLTLVKISSLNFMRIHTRIHCSQYDTFIIFHIFLHFIVFLTKCSLIKNVTHDHRSECVVEPVQFSSASIPNLVNERSSGAWRPCHPVQPPPASNLERYRQYSRANPILTPDPFKSQQLHYLTGYFMNKFNYTRLSWRERNQLKCYVLCKLRHSIL